MSQKKDNLKTDKEVIKLNQSVYEDLVKFNEKIKKEKLTYNE